ncbi:MAG: DUF927 domain-containing protein [Lachnospiraceae bacterium]|nr:DUF927 domain-containing protein [Lachnospiraceae bacterium]
MDNFTSVVEKNKKAGYKYPLIVIWNDNVLQLKLTFLDDGQINYKREMIVSRKMEIVEAYEDIQTKEITYKLCFLTVSGISKEINVTALQIADTNKILELARFGVDVNAINSKTVIKHLNNEAIKVKFKNATTSIGFVKVEEKHTVFVGSRTIEQIDGKIKKSELEYSGSISLDRKGKLENAISEINTILENNPNLQLAVSMGIGALVVGYLRDFGIIQPNIVAHISGDSTTGKTTALKLAVSLFGNVLDNNSLFSSWNTTDNAMQEMLAGNEGIPVALDEAGMMRNKNRTALIYALSQGKEKQRMYFGKGNNEIRTWNTLIISSGEIPIDDDDSDQATGVGVRLVKFNGIQWTISAEEADNVIKYTTSYYGTIGSRCARLIMKLGLERIKQLHQKEAKLISELLYESKVKERLANTLAVFSVAAIVLKKSGVKVEPDKIREIVSENANLQHNIKSSLGERAFIAIKSYLISKSSLIEKRLKNGSAIVPLLGDYVAIAYGTGSNLENYKTEEIAFERKALEKVLRENGFANTKEVLNQWKKTNRLKENNKGGLYHKVKMGGIQVDSIRLLIGGTELEED